MTDLRKALIERRSIELTPELANHYLKYNTFEAQRPLKPEHIKELSEKMIDGRFRFGEIALAYSIEKQQDVMMNGQHVCFACIKTETTIPCIFERFGPLNEHELSTLFRQFEIEPRSLKDMVRVESIALKLSWSVGFSSLLVSAAILTGTKKSRAGGSFTREQKVKLLNTVIKEGNYISQVVTSQTVAKHLWKAPVFYAMFLTFRKDPSASYISWEKVKSGEKMTRDMPEMKLREYLINMTGSSIKFAGRRAENHEIISKCVMAWNAFRERRTTNLGYKPSRPIPVIK